MKFLSEPNGETSFTRTDLENALWMNFAQGKDCNVLR